MIDHGRAIAPGTAAGPKGRVGGGRPEPTVGSAREGATARDAPAPPAIGDVIRVVIFPAVFAPPAVRRCRKAVSR
ncbi:hypothetical protein [Saccharothrix xinjiangensis]|uniref:Uncharacterized protein n=1 Tax=Saccharothrix xinjiangensis TaxID=204798 RepID=A0ABV9XRV7_9PSEU